MKNEILKIANIHVMRIDEAIQRIKSFFPITTDVLSDLTINELVWIELLVSRFGKLQDLMGSKLIAFFFEDQKEEASGLTMLDKINKLEYFGIIEEAEVWSAMRRVRNLIAHEYPENPALMAKYLNEIFDLTPQLITIFNKIKEKIQ